jgi:hypothetical protein
MAARTTGDMTSTSATPANFLTIETELSAASRNTSGSLSVASGPARTALEIRPAALRQRDKELLADAIVAMGPHERPYVG